MLGFVSTFRVERSSIPVPFIESEGSLPSKPEGVVASFYPDGQLRQLSLWWDGEEAFPHLELAPVDALSSSLFDGRALHNGSWVARVVEEYTSELYYPDGRVECFSRWDDAYDPWQVDWCDWVQEWIAQIVERSERAREIVEDRRAQAAQRLTPWPLAQSRSFARAAWDFVAGFGRSLLGV